MPYPDYVAIPIINVTETPEEIQDILLSDGSIPGMQTAAEKHTFISSLQKIKIMLDEHIEAMKREILERALKKENVIVIGCDGIETEKINNVGFIAGDPIALALSITIICEKEPALYATFKAAIAAYERTEDKTIKN